MKISVLLKTSSKCRFLFYQDFCFLDKEFTVKPNHLGAMCSLQQDQIGEGILVSAKVRGILISYEV